MNFDDLIAQMHEAATDLHGVASGLAGMDWEQRESRAVALMELRRTLVDLSELQAAMIEAAAQVMKEQEQWPKES